MYMMLSFVGVCFVSAATDIDSWSVPSIDVDKHYIPVVRQADVDNHNSEGGLWIVTDGAVYDISHLRSQFLPQQVEQCIREFILSFYFLYSQSSVHTYIEACYKSKLKIIGVFYSFSTLTLLVR